jgi:hypothetical protein
MNGAVYPLIGALLTLACATALGLSLLQRLRISLTRVEHYLFAFLTGSAALSLLVLWLAALHLARKGVFLVVAACLVTLAYRSLAKTNFEPRLRSSASRWLAALLLATAIPFAAVYLFTAWAPEVSADGAGYHLGNVLQYCSHHGLVAIRDLYGALPEGMEMLFLFAFTIGRHSAAALVHLGFLFALPLMVICYSLRFGSGKAGLCAAALVFLSPVVGQDGSVAYNDVALAAAAFGVVYAIELWLIHRQNQLLILAGALAGFCFSIKYTGIVAAVYALSIIGFRVLRDRPVRVRTVVLFAIPALIVASPWLIRNAVYMHNPVAPFFNRVFPNPYVSPKFESDYAESMAHYAGTTSARELAVKYTVTGAGVVGFLGPLFLLAPLGLIVLRTPRGRRLLWAAVLFGLPIIANGGTRFLIPAVPCLALALGMAVETTRFAVPFLILVQALAACPAVEALYCDQWAWHIAEAPVRAVFNRKTAEEYMQAQLGPGWEIARLAEQRTPPGARIFCFSCPPQAYSSRPLSVYYESLEARALWDMLWTPSERARQPLKRISLAFPDATVQRLRVALAAANPNQVWTVAEMRILSHGAELRRSPQWKIHASPDPWEAPFAFDNSPVSKWSAEQYGARGAFLEVAFDRPEAADAIVLECPEDAPEQLAVWAEPPGQRMIRLSTRIASTAVKPPAGMRRAAVKMLETYGYEYLVVAKGDYYADDYRKYAPFWGIRSIAEAGDWTLYHLE